MSNLRQAARQALEALEGVLDDDPKVLEASISGGLYEVVQCRDAITALRAALAEPEQEPVGNKWEPCVKLPVTVHVRAQRPGETHVSTREGITPVKPDDLIMRGVSGEEYPIGRDIFERTYQRGEAPPQRKPLTDKEIEREWASAPSVIDFTRAIEAAHGIKGKA